MKPTALSLCLLAFACGRGSPTSPADGGSDAGAIDAGTAGQNVPLFEATADQVKAFTDGNAQFDQPFLPSGGLGPTYVATSCGACHQTGGRGPGIDERMVMMNADGTAPLADQSALAFGHEIRTLLTAGAKTPVEPPASGNVLVTTRVPPAVLGRGYMEAVLDSEILRMESEQAARTDGIHGHANRVTYTSEISADPAYGNHVKGDSLIGRFGLKARVATLDDFAADALQNDMGITSPLRPAELPNPDGLTDDEKPGVDTTAALVSELALYMRLTDIPARAPADPRGQQLFAQLSCNVCHAPALKTRSDYPVPQLAGIDAPVYTDFLLHDFGPGYLDGMVEFSAGATEFRTPPLIGVRFLRAYLNDGRARDVKTAIELHAGEGQAASDAFKALSPGDQTILTTFVESL